MGEWLLESLLCLALREGRPIFEVIEEGALLDAFCCFLTGEFSLSWPGSGIGFLSTRRTMGGESEARSSDWKYC